MTNQDSSPLKPPDSSKSKVGETTLESSGQVLVTRYSTPPKSRPDKRIHPRRPLRPVPEAPSKENNEKLEK